jgi:AcrR family transcriptional regulator
MSREPRLPKQRRSIATKEHLRRAAAELFAEQGYRSTTSKHIAARAEVAVGSFYAYYRNKKEILLDVIGDYYRRITAEAFPAEGLPEGIPAGKSTDFIGDLVRRLYEAHRIEPKLHREITGLRYTDPEVAEFLAAEDERVVRLVAQLLRRSQEQLRVDDVEAAARVIHRSAEEVIHSLRMFGLPEGPDRVLPELSAMLRRYLFGS